MPKLCSSSCGGSQPHGVSRQCAQTPAACRRYCSQPAPHLLDGAGALDSVVSCNDAHTEAAKVVRLRAGGSLATFPPLGLGLAQHSLGVYQVKGAPICASADHCLSQAEPAGSTMPMWNSPTLICVHRDGDSSRWRQLSAVPACSAHHVSRASQQRTLLTVGLPRALVPSARSASSSQVSRALRTSGVHGSVTGCTCGHK